MEKVPVRNSGESANEWTSTKSNTQLPSVENRGGSESGVSETAGRGAVAETYSAPSGNNGINGTYENADRAAKWKGKTVDISPQEASEFK